MNVFSSLSLLGIFSIETTNQIAGSVNYVNVTSGYPVVGLSGYLVIQCSGYQVIGLSSGPISVNALRIIFLYNGNPFCSHSLLHKNYF